VQVEYIASAHASHAIAAIGRTEDVKFSPNNRRLAVAAYHRNAIFLLEVCINDPSSGKSVAITDALEISSPCLNNPHGVDFIDDETIIVASRGGDVCIFRVPASGAGNAQLQPIEIIRSGDVINTPGSVSVAAIGEGRYEALLCNNYANKITSHQIDSTRNCVVERSDVLLEKWLNVPDGVSVNGDWIAVSNHNTHNVLLFDKSSGLNNRSDPTGILRCVYYPHGLRFTRDGRFMLVADAGSPFVHIYGRGASGWRGVHLPLKSLRTLTNEEFSRGRANLAEGGPKGLDVDSSASILVTTCETRPLTFFNISEILSGLSQHQTSDHSDEPEAEVEQRYRRYLEMKYELHIHSKLSAAR